MLTHVVMFKLHETADKTEIQHDIKRRLDSLPPQIAVIRAFEVGLNVLPSARAYDLVLVSKYDSLATLAEYNTHPAHVAHLEFIRNACASIIAVDYEDS